MTATWLIAVALLAGWHVAPEPMSRITEPREVVTVATMPMSWHATDCEAFAGAAGAAMGPGDVAITLWERKSSAGFAPRPPVFGPVPDAEPAGPGCGEPDGTMIHWRDFSSGGRDFHSLVRVGPAAPPEAAAQAWQILGYLAW